MQTTDDTCPIQSAFAVFGRRWTLIVLWYLRTGTLRFGEIRRNLPEISDRILSLTLKDLQDGGFVLREAFAEVPPRVEYTLTDRGKEVAAIAHQLAMWAFRDAAGSQ